MEEESTLSTVREGRITGVRFALATCEEISTSSSSNFPITHASQLSNPFLGLPLQCGKCESCGAFEAGQCEGHFGCIELPVPIYHPSHISELKRLLSLVCLKCLKVKTRKSPTKKGGLFERVLTSCCEEASQISINEVMTTEGAGYLQLKLPSKSRFHEGCWNFLQRYGYRYGDKYTRPLLPSEVMVIMKKLPPETKKKLAAKGVFPQDGYIMQNLPVPPNTLSVPDVSDGITVMSSDLSVSMLKKLLRKIEIIKSSRSGTPNFEGQEVEANDLQVAVAQYLDIRGTSKASRDMDARFGIRKEASDSTKAWLEKIKTLFIRKGSGFSSRSVITGDAYKGVSEIGLPSEIAQRITFEERVTEHNIKYLQKLVDDKMCLTYRDGQSTYSLKEGSKGHTFLKPGQVVHRRVMEGDIVFINRPPTTHKHSLQALAVYVHDDHTVKINPLICGPLSADFDGDCVHLFYPQSLAAKAEVVELFSVEKQLLCSHNSKLNLQVGTDSLLSLKIMFKNCFLTRKFAQQLAMFLANPLPEPAFLKPEKFGHQWTASQILESALPRSLDCSTEKFTIRGSEILKIEFTRETVQSGINEILASLFQEKGPDEVLNFLNSLQPMLMESLFAEGFSVDLKDLYIDKDVLENMESRIQEISPLLQQVRVTYNELVDLQIDSHLRLLRGPIANLVLSSSGMGSIIDSKSENAISKVVQQIGFLGIQLTDKGKFYTKTLVGDMASLFQTNYPFRAQFPSEEYGLVRGCLFHGLDPYQEMVHSISAREVIVRSSRGLTEPGTLFKNLMAILRDVNVCYDGTVRNLCSNAVIQFQYGTKAGIRNSISAGEPVGVLAATAMSNPAYKAVLDSSSSSNSSWEMMKEILLCPASFKNDLADRQVTLYLSDCECGRKYCRENAAYMVKNHLKKVSLKDIAVDFLIEYNGQQILHEGSDSNANLVAHLHLNKSMFQNLHVTMLEVCQKVQNAIDLFVTKKGMKKKDVSHLFKRLKLSGSECCSSFGNSCGTNMPCLTFFWPDITELHLDETSQALTHLILPVLLESVIKGDTRVCAANIIWVAPDTTTWMRNPSASQSGELALDVLLEREAVKQSGDAWRVVMDSCLPIIHLIDTSRSTPNAIKQVQELLGISCAFDQAVQRLSTSVSMVVKGVVKEHLILLANSMTYAGTMIGFNSGGIKALSRSSNVQVPFAEATLFTPKKCFEKAAEKCHVDSLASIVASCSWGKQVSVGTGSRFDLLWNTREIGEEQKDGIDVYDFLYLVRSREGEVNSACLGAEVDDFDVDYDNGEWAMSPEHGADQPTFDDAIEVQNGFEERASDQSNDDWVEKSHTGNSGDGNWGSGANTLKPNAWTAWGTNSAQKDDHLEIASTSQKEVLASGSWGPTQKGEASGGKVWGSGDNTHSSWEATPTAKENGGPGTSSSTWGMKTVERNDEPTSIPWKSSKSDDPVAVSAYSWGSTQKGEATGGRVWDGSEKNACTPWKSGTDSAGDSLNATQRCDTTCGKGWGGGEKNVHIPWKSGKEDGHVADSTGDFWGSSQKGEFTGGKDWGGGGNNGGHSSSWGAKSVQRLDDSSSTPWKSGKNDDSGADSAGGKEWFTVKKKTGDDATWSKSSGGSAWGAKSSTQIENDSSQLAEKNDELSGGNIWDTGKKNSSGEGTTWSSKPSGASWGPKRAQTDVNSPTTRGQNEATGGIWSSKPVGSSNETSQWGTPRGFNSEKEQQADDQNESPGNIWSPRQGGDSESSRWGPTRRFNNSKKEQQGDSPRGWGSAGAGEWKQKASGALFTATRQRLDMFTSEEQEILQEVEPIMLSLRRIMRYNDGDPLSADDQSYILENVFNHHPDKTAKMGVGIDHFMVNKHGSFQDTRCLYVVTTDGHNEDFSYRKCLENLVKTKYPELADDFNAKYFKKPQPRTPMNRERSVGLEREQSIGPDRERSVGVEELGLKEENS